MKKNLVYIIVSFVIFCNLSFAQSTDKITWHSFEDAVTLNSVNHKMIFIDIYTDWCGWCKVLDKSTFPDSTITRLMNKYFIAVKLNAERKDTIMFNGYAFVNPNPDGYRSPHQLASSLLKGRMGYPSLCFMDDSVRLITTVQSYLKPNELEPILEYIGSGKYLTVAYDTFKLSYNPISGTTAAIKTISEKNNASLNIEKYLQGNSDIPKEAYVQIDSLASMMKTNTTMKIEIGGYCDNSTLETSDGTLSETRAKKIYDYLVNAGIESTRMTYAGYGILNPAGDNATPEGQAKNRRVEFKFSSK